MADHRTKAYLIIKELILNAHNNLCVYACVGRSYSFHSAKGYAIMQLENLQVITMLEKLSTVDNCDHHKVTNKYTYIQYHC